MSEIVQVVPSDVFPVVQRFLLESGLQRTLKAFQKETEAGVDEAASVPKKRKRLLKRINALELTTACQLWLEQHPEISQNCEEKAEDVQPPKKKSKKQVVDEAAAAAAVQDEVEPQEEQKLPKKKTKTRLPATETAAESEAVAAVPEAKHEAPVLAATVVTSPVLAAKKKKSKEDKAQKTAGVPFQRVDADKWIKTVKDERMLDNTHKATGGDAWGERASEDMLKVKGKGFRKEMAKKKRASWKGCGELDQGTHSIKFDNSSDEE
jgi:hypothetical protein